jgi:hypothetical protein
MREWYELRNEPEAIAAMAAVAWNVLLISTLAGLIALAAYAFFIYQMVMGTISDARNVALGRSITLDRTELETLVRKIEERSSGVQVTSTSTTTATSTSAQ